MPSSSSLSSSSKRKPLLIDDNDDNNNEKLTKQQQQRPAEVQRWSVHIIFCLLPLLGTFMILLTLFELLDQDMSMDSMKSHHISDRLANYDSNYLWIFIPIIIGGTCMFIVTKARNIQIQVYISRQQQQRQTNNIDDEGDDNSTSSNWTCFGFINAFAAFVNIIAYAGFILLGIFRVGDDQAMVTNTVSVHRIAAITYFIGVYIYAILHTYMIIQQEPKQRYPLILKIVFTLLTISGIGCICMYAYSEKTTPENPQHIYEWLSAFIAAIYISFFTILFHIDPVDDELFDFFLGCRCCCRRRRRRRRGSNKLSGRQQQEDVV